MAQHKLGARILLAVFTWDLDMSEREHALSKLGYKVECKRYTSFTPESDRYDLILQLGIGPQDGPSERDMAHGLEFLSNLRAKFPKVPILVVSNHDPIKVKQQILECGADDIVERFYQGEMFIEKVENLLNRGARAA